MTINTLTNYWKYLNIPQFCGSQTLVTDELHLKYLETFANGEVTLKSSNLEGMLRVLKI